jgi:uncharacterized protein
VGAEGKTAEAPSGDGVESPCIGVCALDANTGLCRGCLRTGAEIGAWRDADDRMRLAILEQVRRRREETASSCG